MSLVFATKDAGVGNGKGKVFRIRRGEAWDAKDAVVKTNPSFFTAEPPDVHTSAGVRRSSDVVERATAAPGEKRRR